MGQSLCLLMFIACQVVNYDHKIYCNIYIYMQTCILYKYAPGIFRRAIQVGWPLDSSYEGKPQPLPAKYPSHAPVARLKQHLDLNETDEKV